MSCFDARFIKFSCKACQIRRMEAFIGFPYQIIADCKGHLFRYIPGSLCGFPRGNMVDRPRRLVKAPKRFSCDFSTVSRIKDATNAKKDRKVYDIEVVEIDRKETNIANTYKRIMFKNPNFKFIEKQQV